MFNISSHQRNSNENNPEMTPSPSQNGRHLETVADADGMATGARQRG